MVTHIGKQTLRIDTPVFVAAGAAVGGKLEGEGPLRDRFDELSEDSYFGQKSWEAAETVMLRRAFDLALSKTKLPQGALRYVLSGDLQNQCTGSAYASRDLDTPYLGLYSACATMGEALGLGALLTAVGAGPVCAMTSSHFCSAERQFRTPLEYGSQRSPVAQWTATAAGAALLCAGGDGPRVTHITTGKIVDAGLTDIGNMGAAMAPAALDTLLAHFRDTGREPKYYDAVITGDLAKFGHEILAGLLREEGLDMPTVFTDCGMLLYDPASQDVHSGGSGAGCSASVFAGHILRCLRDGIWSKVLFAPTGALMSTVTVQQGESIPAICHAVALEVPGESHAEAVERREGTR
ncbi:MAG: stage V sporulation protein AD [Oscillospiraceae bacterium]|nr:stage V sporulation protein AD [Oscillospiraceae bacterium]